jgi:hypothetical protein
MDQRCGFRADFLRAWSLVQESRVGFLPIGLTFFSRIEGCAEVGASEYETKRKDR